MELKTIFRTLILLMLAMDGIYLMLMFGIDRNLPPELTSYAAHQYDTSMTTIDIIVGIGLLVVLIAGIYASIALLFFVKHARLIFVMSRILSLCLSLGSPAAVVTAIESFFVYFSAMITGAIVVLIYASPMKEVFGKSNT